MLVVGVSVLGDVATFAVCTAVNDKGPKMSDSMYICQYVVY
jgi:hypothetical protein